MPILEESTDPKIREGNDAKWRKNADQFAREKMPTLEKNADQIAREKMPTLEKNADQIAREKMPTLEKNVDQIARVMMPNRAPRNQFEIQKAHTDKRAICPNDFPGNTTK